MENKFYELVKDYFRNNYSAYATLGLKPVYDDFIEALEALDVDNIDYAICDDTKEILKVKKVNGVVTVKWN